MTLSHTTVLHLEDTVPTRPSQQVSSSRSPQSHCRASLEPSQPSGPQIISQSAQEKTSSQWHWPVWSPGKGRIALLGLLLGMTSLVVTVAGLAPSFEGLRFGKTSANLDIWQAKVTFRQWCQDENIAGKNITRECSKALAEPLPPPPVSKRTYIQQSGSVVDRQNVAWDKELIASVIVLTIFGLFIRKHANRIVHAAFLPIFRRFHEVDELPLFSRHQYHDLEVSKRAPSPPVRKPVQQLPNKAQIPPPSSKANEKLLDLVFQEHQRHETNVQQPVALSIKAMGTKSTHTTKDIVKKRTTDQYFSMGTVPRSTVNSYVTRGRHLSDAETVEYPVLTEETSSVFNMRTMMETEKAFINTMEDRFIVHDDDHHDWTLLHLATARGDLEAVKNLLGVGGVLEVNTEDAMGRTALYLAVLRDHVEIAELLVKHGAVI